MEREHLKPSHRTRTWAFNVLNFLGLLLFLSSFSSSFFVYERKRTLSGFLLVFPEFSTCRTRAFCVPPLFLSKNIPSFFVFIFFSPPLFPSASLPTCPSLTPTCLVPTFVRLPQIFLIALSRSAMTLPILDPPRRVLTVVSPLSPDLTP
jgi:hypothetical protein